MCFNISNTRKIAELEARFSAVLDQEEAQWIPRAEISGFTRPLWPLLCGDRPSEFQWSRWGLIPQWMKDLHKGNDLALKTLNGRVETLREKPSFRDSVNRRCLIPVTGFFEPHHRNGKVYPFLFSKQNQDLFALGGLYCDNPINPEPWPRSFSILTVAADEETARIHNRKKRMPLLIPEDSWSSWLFDDFSEELWQSINKKPRQLKYWPVSNEIYSRNRSLKGDALLEPVAIPPENGSDQLDLAL